VNKSSVSNIHIPGSKYPRFRWQTTRDT